VFGGCGTALQSEVFRPLGAKAYEVEGAAITVAWKAFPPREVVASHERQPSHSALLYLPGWSFTERTKAIAPLCQAAAEYAQEMTYAVDTSAAARVPHSLAYEAEAVRRWLQESRISTVTLMGDSQGGAQAMHLAVLLQESHPETEVRALVLYNSVGLYDQPIRTLLRTYIQEGHQLRREVARMAEAKEVSRLLLHNLTEGCIGYLGHLFVKKTSWALITLLFLFIRWYFAIDRGGPYFSCTGCRRGLPETASDMTLPAGCTSSTDWPHELVVPLQAAQR
jgi:pimeloyl-ACP methyl ester carboxylesterase